MRKYIFKFITTILAILLIILINQSLLAVGDSTDKKEKLNTDSDLSLTEETAFGFSKLALRCIQKEYPYKPGHVINNPDDVKKPGELHPAFYGCFDWHSAVHGHWMLVKLLKKFPNMRNVNEIRSAIDKNLSAGNILKEVEYLKEPNRKSFERTYGWAWLLKLTEELYGWDDPDGRRWASNLKPLADELTSRYIDFLPRQTYPIRTGVHPNTAFGLAFALDYAEKTGNRELEKLIKERSIFYYMNDCGCPAEWEPGGEDFFSPCLLEADLMRRVLDKDKFEKWLKKFMPGLKKGEPENLFKPAVVADRTDPKIVHLDGLNLSRAWCMYGVASVLDEKCKIRKALLESAERHLKDALANVMSGHYEGEHWLASFAVYALNSKKLID